MANDTQYERYLIIVNNEIALEEWGHIRDLSRELDVFRRMFPGKPVLIAKVVISEDEL